MTMLCEIKMLVIRSYKIRTSRCMYLSEIGDESISSTFCCGSVVEHSTGFVLLLFRSFHIMTEGLSDSQFIQ